MGLFGNKAAAVADAAKGAVEGIGNATETIINAARGVNPELELAGVELQKQVIIAQSKINEIEAANTNLFVSGWRPGLGWSFVLAINLEYVIRPIAEWIATLTRGEVFALPKADLLEMIPVLIGMLGLGYYRTREKEQGVQGKH